MREAGVQIPDEVLLEASTLQNKKKLTEAVQAAAQQRTQLEQMQLQATLEEQQARTELAQARAIADKGLGLERASRVEENQAFATERYAEAQKDNAMADLNVVKALKEIEEVDIRQLEKLIALSRVMTQENVRDQRAHEAAKKNTMAEAEKLATANVGM